MTSGSVPAGGPGFAVAVSASVLPVVPSDTAPLLAAPRLTGIGLTVNRMSFTGRR